MVVAYLRVSTNKQHLENTGDLILTSGITTLSVEKYIVMTEN